MANATCSIESCKKPSRSKGWCEMHYSRWRAHGDPLIVLRRGRPRTRLVCSAGGCGTVAAKKGFCEAHYRRAAKGLPLDTPLRQWRRGGICAVEGCDRPHAARGLCSMHWQRKQNTGDVGPVDPLVAPAGSGTIRDGYRVVRRDGKDIGEHRAVMEDLLGRPLVKGETVHHVNGQRADNATDGPLKDYRSGNLELWSTWQPAGQRVSDKIQFAVELLTLYRPELLASGAGPDLIRQTLEKESVRG